MQLAEADRAALVEAAVAELGDDPAAGARELSWLLYRQVRLAGRVGVERPLLDRQAAAIPDAGLRGLAQLALLRSDFAAGQQPDADRIGQMGADGSLARARAWELLAWHQARRDGRDALSAVDAWPPEARMFGQVGAALALQGQEL
jgi:hypothetical protein